MFTWYMSFSTNIPIVAAERGRVSTSQSLGLISQKRVPRKKGACDTTGFKHQGS